MNMKTFMIILGVLIVILLGVNYRINKQMEQRNLEAQARAQAQMQEAELRKQERANKEKQKKLKAEIEQMPINAKAFLTKKFPNPEQQDFSPQPQDSYYRKELGGFLQVWSDDVKLAGSTARIALPNVIAKLQEDRRKLEEMQATPCVTFAQAYLYASMDDTINGFLSFMGKDETMSSYYANRANKNLEVFEQKIDSCQA